jgi:CelD/BcsL family acetyltransferase involved in cellulose biosynthesis
VGRELALVLIAGVSLHERRMVESTLKKSGLTTVAVEDAEDAARELSAKGVWGVLVIDSGLLQAAHDPQWRQLRSRHPGLGAAVRCLIPRDKASRRTDGNTLLVHPDDEEGLREAVRVLAAMAADSPGLPAPWRGAA